MTPYGHLRQLSGGGNLPVMHMISHPLARRLFVIAASGGLFGATYALQILCILGSMWFGKAKPAGD